MNVRVTVRVEGPSSKPVVSKDQVRLPNPARPGDTVSYVTECISRRASASRDDRGIITLADELSNQRGEPVLTQQVTLLVARRAAGESRCALQASSAARY